VRAALRAAGLQARFAAANDCVTRFALAAAATGVQLRLLCVQRFSTLLLRPITIDIQTQKLGLPSILHAASENPQSHTERLPEEQGQPDLRVRENAARLRSTHKKRKRRQLQGSLWPL